MTLRVGKTAVVLLLGLVLAWQGLFPASAYSPQAPETRAKACCRPRSQCTNCETPACCARPAEPSSPSSPVRSSANDELQASALPPIVSLALYSPSCGEPLFPLLVATVPRLPLFP